MCRNRTSNMEKGTWNWEFGPFLRAYSSRVGEWGILAATTIPFPSTPLYSFLLFKDRYRSSIPSIPFYPLPFPVTLSFALISIIPYFFLSIRFLRTLFHTIPFILTSAKKKPLLPTPCHSVTFHSIPFLPVHTRNLPMKRTRPKQTLKGNEGCG